MEKQPAYPCKTAQSHSSCGLKCAGVYQRSNTQINNTVAKKQQAKKQFAKKQ